MKDKLSNIFNRRKYEISFKKSRQDYHWDGEFSWTEITDSNILCVLSDLQEKYNFTIISLKLKDSLHESKIKIRCNKEDKNKIFINFCTKLSGEIENIEM